jgi:site-specific DNA-methyltransferase (adenine-specific)
MELTNKIILGDIFDGLKSLENDLIDCAVTSPPYWGQRDYQFDGQIGNEIHYKEYIEKLVSAFLILKDKLKSQGIFFLNIGDKYISKYGNAPLGMIPYKLAYFMCKFGWKLVDTIIWYKPNHMPSSIKNRFTNTYEPVFVFAKSAKNYYEKFKKQNSFSNILKIPTQPTPYEHMAVYPEKLIEALIGFGIPKDGVILDPFAGSGTTAKAVLNLNNLLVENNNYKFIMIEANEKYIDIIKNRCNLNSQSVIKVPHKKYNLIKIDLDFHFPPKVDRYEYEIKGSIFSKKGIIKIFDNKNNYFAFINSMINGRIKNVLNDEGIVYAGLLDKDINAIYETSKLNENGWIVRNQIIVSYKNSWFPIYLIVKDTKKVEYYFNIDAVRVEHKTQKLIESNPNKFIGYKVIDNFSSSQQINGKIIDIKEMYDDGIPKLVYVKWNDKKVTREYIQHKEETSQFIKFICPNCNFELIDYYNNGNTSCSECKTNLWTKVNSIPNLIEALNYDIGIEKTYYKKELNLSLVSDKKYNGKFKNALKINMGASPGARSSTQEEYFSVQRFYNVNQALVCDYLNLKREAKGLTKIEFTNLFPKQYKHTVGHWMRKDMGGSLPTIEDWQKIKSILDIDDSYTNYVCRKSLKLQTVKPSHKGKNPGDFLEKDVKVINEYLEKTFQ